MTFDIDTSARLISLFLSVAAMIYALYLGYLASRSCDKRSRMKEGDRG